MAKKPDTENKPGEKQETKSLNNLISELGVSPEQGLSDSEAESRIEKYGHNELVEEKVNPLLKFFTYFWGPIPWMIEAAVVLLAIVRHWADFIIIFVLLIMNAVVGFWEEYQAGNTIEALKKKLALETRVRRDGKWENIPARQLVPGDIIRLRLGDIIPADAKLLDGDPIEVDQSTLTGESLPVECKKEDNVYSGSIVNQGEIEALVYATGTKTYFGKTEQMVEGAKSTSHFQKAVLKIGDYLIVIAIALVVLLLITALFCHESMLTTLRFALVLTVAAIPVAMPTVLSVTMAVDLTTRAALRVMIVPGFIPTLGPVVVGALFCLDRQYDTTMVVAALLMVGTIASILMASFMNKGSGAWSNAKKCIEDRRLKDERGNVLGKGSAAHAAIVVGDTVGDPFKDTAGPSLHVLGKLLSTITLVMCPLLI